MWFYYLTLIQTCRVITCFRKDAWGLDFYQIDKEPKFSNFEGSDFCQVDRE